ncbi:TadE/TadG family type IV pilus assembly protein [Neptunicoccus cionae]|uniref:TadE-like domain-containing protein n=1 Tax=Neptunicoccus cionae TaxID=2035344 RepID=A0A916R0J4_9RHOB|nr:TadE family protein [Amylibacter cionae]GGA24645.1 hypothetical protein GCM10011498_27090 [Amylibacter cionae]
MRSNFSKLIKRTRHNEDGGVSVEFMLWVPVFVALMTGAVDVGTIFAYKTNYWGVARDTARQVARHAMSASEAEAYAREMATYSGVEPDTEVEITANDVTVRLIGYADTIASFGIFKVLQGTEISAEVTYALEPI